MRKRIGAALESDEPRAHDFSVTDLTKRIESFREDSIGGVFALVGPWGSGKSSLAKAAAAQLVKNHDWKVATFEPWAYGDYPSMLDGFFRILKEQLSIKILNRGTRNTLEKFFRSVAPLGGIGGIFGFPLTDAIAGTGKLIGKRQDFVSMRAEASAIFAKSTQPIMIIIEDIDRLDSTELMNCFRLIRLLGELDNVYYLLCYDEQTVIDVMQNTDVIGNGREPRARAYLEKIAQVRVEVLDLFGEEQKELWDREYSRFVSEHQFTPDEQDHQRIQYLWEEVFESYLRWPRAISRYWVQMSSMWSSVAGEVNFPDFAAITFLRTFEPAVFYDVRESQEELLKPGYSNSETAKMTKDQRREHWENRASVSGSRDPRRVFLVLAMLFSSIRDNSIRYPLSTFEPPKSVGSELYFDRYFRNSLAREDIPEHYYRAYLDDVIQEEFCEKSKKVRAALAVRDRYVWERLEQEVTDADRNSEPILLNLQSQYGELMSVGSIATRRDDNLVRFALVLERGMSSDFRRFAWYENMSAHRGGVAVLSELFLERWRNGIYDMDSLQDGELMTSVRSLVERRIREELQKDPEIADHSVMRGVALLQYMSSHEEARDFLRQVVDESEHWCPLDAVTSLLSVQITHSGDGLHFSTRRYSLEMETVEHWAGLEWVQRTIGPVSSDSPKLFRWTDKRPLQSELRDLAKYEIGRLNYAKQHEEES